MNLKIGQIAETTKTFTTEDVILFSQVSTDTNPIHLNQSYAENTVFKNPICHGFLVGSLISAVIANKLPGNGSIYIEQNLLFRRPVFHNDTITAKVEITEIIEEKKIVKLNTICKNQNGEIVIEGNAILKVPFLHD